MPLSRILERSLSCLTILSAALVLTACDTLTGLVGSDKAEVETVVESTGSFGPCLDWYFNGVISASMNDQGSRILFLTDEKPPTLSDDTRWLSDDRAIMVSDRQADGTMRERHIVLTWDPVDSIAPYATSEASGAPGEATPTPEALGLTERMVMLAADRAGTRFVVGVERSGTTGGLAKLYAGRVPEPGAAPLSPQDGTLTVIPINRYEKGQPIQSFALSPDGSKVAAIVGAPGELRVYDLDAQENQLWVYEADAQGRPRVSHELPEVSTSVSSYRNPLVSGTGSVRMIWSPDGERIALSRTVTSDAPGSARLEVFQVADGGLALVRSYAKSTIPHAAWASDGQSLFVMNTPLYSTEGQTSDTVFQDTEIRRIEAAEDGDDIGQGAKIKRPLGVRSDPIELVGFGDDAHFVFLWEGRLIRLDAPGGDLSQATFQPISGPAEDLTVLYEAPTASLSADTVAYLVSSGGNHVGMRRSATQASCPEIAAPTEAEAEGETGDGAAAPAEGESAGDGGEAAPTAEGGDGGG